MRRRIFDNEGHAFFVTFSCYRRRRLLDDNQAKGIVIHFLSEQLKNQQGSCVGFVVMPEHVHALIHFNENGQLSIFMNQWKRRSSMQLKKLYRNDLSAYGRQIDLEGPMWQPKYYAFNVYSEKKAKEKLDYMHNNPVKAGLVENAVDWPHSSARWYFLGKSVGVAINETI
ncbi:MAG: transposase [Syntrophobacteraceae bacterium]